MSAEDQRWLALQRQVLLGAVASLVAHEFGNLMTPVLARAQTARGGVDVDEMRRALDCTVTQTERAMSIARRLLEAAAGSELRWQSVAVASALEQALAILARPLSKDGIRLEVDAPADLCVRAEPVLLEQLLVNLLLDARQALEEQQGAWLRIRAAREQDRIRIEFSDNGNCAAPDDQGVFLAVNGDHPRDWQRVGLPQAACRVIADLNNAQYAVASRDGVRVHTLLWPMG